MRVERREEQVMKRRDKDGRWRDRGRDNERHKETIVQKKTMLERYRDGRS